ncbi:hypothetical protein RyT2_11550 [Pseudolactococcus yaeyamensis]
MNETELKAQERAVRVERKRLANGFVLRMVNIGSGFKRLSDFLAIAGARQGITEAEFWDAVEYVHEEGYVRVRVIGTTEIVREIADVELRRLEAKLTNDGDRILDGVKHDALVEV